MRAMSASVAIGLACGLCVVVTACGGGSFASNPNAGGADTGGNSTGANSSGGSATGGSTGSGGTIVTGTPIALADYPNALAQTFCPPLADCCATLGVTLTVDQCTTTLTGLSADYATADPANYTYDPVAAGTCVASAGEAFASNQCLTGKTSADPFCTSVFTGKLAPGQPCAAKVECAVQTGDTASCSELVAGAGTVCVVERRVTVGQPCYWTCTEQSGGFRICSGNGSDRTALEGRCFTNDGAYCATDSICRTQVGLGAACTGNHACAEGFCDFTTGLCTARALQGGGCTSDDGCADGLYCSTQQCVSKLAPGSPCTLSNACLDGSCKNGACVANAPVDSNQFGMALLCALLTGGLK